MVELVDPEESVVVVVVEPTAKLLPLLVSPTAVFCETIVLPTLLIQHACKKERQQKVDPIFLAKKQRKKEKQISR